MDSLREAFVEGWPVISWSILTSMFAGKLIVTYPIVLPPMLAFSLFCTELALICTIGSLLAFATFLIVSVRKGRSGIWWTISPQKSYTLFCTLEALVVGEHIDPHTAIVAYEKQLGVFANSFFAVPQYKERLVLAMPADFPRAQSLIEILNHSALEAFMEFSKAMRPFEEPSWFPMPRRKSTRQLPAGSVGVELRKNLRMVDPE